MVTSVLVKIEKKISKDRDSRFFHQKEIIRSAKDHNMVSSPDEPYYREQYWYFIEKFLKENSFLKDGNYLDLGCGQGRFSFPLSKWISHKGKITGVDISKEAIIYAKKEAEKEGLNNISYKVEDILPFVKSQKDNSFEGIFFLEVTIYFPEYREVLNEIKRILKPNGFLFVSFRPQYFNMLNILKEKRWDDLLLIKNNRLGKLGGGDVSFTWQTSDEVKDIIEIELNLKILELRAIGPLSGMKGDPHYYISNPSSLKENEKKKLMELELYLSKSLLDNGRYIFCIAQKK